MGILALARRYERERLEAACERALAINAISYSSVSVAPSSFRIGGRGSLCDGGH
jgi:hypothetical protein